MNNIEVYAGNNIENVVNDAINIIVDKFKNLKTLNIIVAGKTGVGKSTLINAVFREKLAEEGIGKPVTAHMRKLTKPGIPLSVYDTRGFELGKDVQTTVKQEILETIKKGIESKDINQVIHCIWYCINTASNRVEPEEIAWLRELSKENSATQVPIIIVLTQSFSKKNAEKLKSILLDENLDVIQIIPVLAENYEIDEEYIVKAFGLDTLIRVMADTLPDELKDTLQNVQIASLEEKKKRAQAAVAGATAAAVGIGASPIPFSDSFLLVPTQLTMIGAITAIFGLEINKSILTAFISSTLGAGGATVLGKTVVTSLLKLIPGVGTIAGGAISAGTAGVITTALGEAYIGVMELIYKGEMSVNDLTTEKGKEKMTTLFKNMLKKKRD